MAEVADVVAVIRAEDGDFTRKMQNADREIQDRARTTEQAEQRTQRSLVGTSRALDGVRAGWVGVAGAAAAAGGLLAVMMQSPTFQAQKAQAGRLIEGTGEQLYRGLSGDDMGRDVNRAIRGITARIRAAREADPTGQGHIMLGRIAEDMERGRGAVIEGRAEGAQRARDAKGPLGGMAEGAGAVLDVAAGVGLGAFGFRDAAARRFARAQGRFAGESAGADVPWARNPVLQGGGPRSTLDLGFGRGSGGGGAEHVVRVIVDAPKDRALREMFEKHLRAKLNRDMGGGFG